MKESYLRGTDEALDYWTKRRGAGDFAQKSLAAFNIAQTTYRTDALFRAIHFMEKSGLDVERAQVLDIGSGQGMGLYPFLLTGFTVSQLHGIEQQEARVQVGKEVLPILDIQRGDAAHLPYEAESFDIVSEQFCFCHIPDETIKPKIAGEMLRVLRPGGFAMILDWRFRSPRHQIYGLGVRRIQELFGLPVVGRFPAQLWPQVGRPLSQYMPSLYPLARRIPFLTGSWITLLKK
ncbi:MAG: class I SAM-dependent methyltransferase [Elusimicrobia bacterium]|nr:class I SAM-dependent methyltransferase [Elusimicrobiota bacterium]